MVRVELGVMDWRGRNRDEVGETTCIVGHVRAFEEEVSNARDQRVNKLEPAVLNCCHLEEGVGMHQLDEDFGTFRNDNGVLHQQTLL